MYKWSQLKRNCRSTLWHDFLSVGKKCNKDCCCSLPTMFHQECHKRFFSLGLWSALVSLGCGLPLFCSLLSRARERTLVVPPHKRISGSKYSECWIFKTTDSVNCKLFYTPQKKKKSWYFLHKVIWTLKYYHQKVTQTGPLSLPLVLVEVCWCTYQTAVLRLELLKFQVCQKLFYFLHHIQENGIWIPLQHLRRNVWSGLSCLFSRICVLATSPKENLEPASGSRTSERFNDWQLIDVNDGTHIKNEFLVLTQLMGTLLWTASKTMTWNRKQSVWGIWCGMVVLASLPWNYAGIQK